MTNLSGSIDTNILLRLLLNDVPEQHIAAKELFRHFPNPVAVADTAVIELVFVLERHYSFSRLQIAEAIDGLIRLKEISCNRVLLENALPLFIEHSGLSFEDCCLSTYAKLIQAEPLWTFDKKLAKQAPNAKLVKT